VQVVILAGGLGTRMGQRTAERPKAMIEVAGEPFIRQQLRLLGEAGIDEVVISIGYLGQLIEAEVEVNHPAGMRVRCVSDGTSLRGTAGAIRRLVADGFTDDQFMVLYGDSYLRVDFGDVWRSFTPPRYSALMTVWRNENELEASNAVVVDGRVGVYRKGSGAAGHPAMEHIDYGLGILTFDTVLDLVPADKPSDLAHLYQRIAAAGRLQAYEVDERFYEIGSETGLLELDRLLSRELQR
jgi:N-acetyl-alpha-D-muramate 1-phosphate uridylyltransferase